MCKQPARKPVQALASHPVLAAVWKLAKAGGARRGLRRRVATAEISITVPVDNAFRFSETAPTILWRDPGLGFDSPFTELVARLHLLVVQADWFQKLLLHETELTRREETKPRLDERRRGRKGEALEWNLGDEIVEEDGGCRSLSMASSPSLSKTEGVRALLLNGYTIFQKKKSNYSFYFIKK